MEILYSWRNRVGAIQAVLGRVVQNGGYQYVYIKYSYRRADCSELYIPLVVGVGMTRPTNKNPHGIKWKARNPELSDDINKGHKNTITRILNTVV